MKPGGLDRVRIGRETRQSILTQLLTGYGSDCESRREMESRHLRTEMRPDLNPHTRERFRIQASSITRMAHRAFVDNPDSHRKAFVLGAKDCLDAAKRMSQGFGDRTPEKILTFHALELGLKAY